MIYGWVYVYDADDGSAGLYGETNAMLLNMFTISAKISYFTTQLIKGKQQQR